MLSEAQLLISGLLVPSQYAGWLAGKEVEAKSQFEARMWVDESNDVGRGHLGGRHFPYSYCRNRVKGTWTACYASMLVKNPKTAVAQGAQRGETKGGPHMLPPFAKFRLSCIPANWHFLV